LSGEGAFVSPFVDKVAVSRGKRLSMNRLREGASGFGLFTVQGINDPLKQRELLIACWKQLAI
jgi:hypothetical protein